MKTAANSRTGRNLNMGFFHYNNLPDSFSFSLEQWTFAPEANIIVYLAQRGAGVTEDNTVLRFIIFLIGFQSRMMPHMVAYLKIVESGIIVLGG